MMRYPSFAIALASVALATAPASAHAFLDHSVPAVGSTVHQPPAEIRIWFTQALEPLFSSIKLSDDKGAAIATGPARADAQDKSVLVLKLPPLKPGGYRVQWHALSVDTHVTQGDFNFTVAP